MKYIRQLCIILMISFIGEVLRYFIPLPIPASIYGLVLMLLALNVKIIKLSSVRDVGRFLIEIMPLMFIPSSVGLISTWGVIQDNFIPVILITFISTLMVMGVTGSITQWALNLKQKPTTTKEGDDDIERDVE